jgi:predicted N-acyltransferase
MKKTFQLAVEGKNPDRVLDAVKHEIRKYIKRERRRVLPEGVDYWDFDCKFGLTPETAEAVHLAAITASIDGVVKQAGEKFYLEILVKPGHRKPRPPADADATQVSTVAPTDDAV